LSKPTIIRQESCSLEFCVVDARPRRFDASRIPRTVQERIRAFCIPRRELEKRFHAVIFTDVDDFTPSVPVQFTLFLGENVEIWDISPDNRVLIAWTQYDGRDGDGGNSHRKVFATATFTEEQTAWIEREWLDRYEHACFLALCDAEIEKAELDRSSLCRRREWILKQKGIDEETVKRKREAALCEAGLDEASVAKKRETIRDRVREQKKSSPPSA
jgi:hypothetical protein